MNEFQIPRNSLAWMLAAQAAVIAPHVTRLSPWIVGVCVACAGWRIMVYQGRWSYPGKWVKVVFVFGALISVAMSYSRLYGLEPAVALLIVAFMLKLLEMQRKRDAFAVIVLAYFVAITEFLFDQAIPMTLYMVAVLTMITAALVGLNQPRSHQHPLRTLRTSAVILAQALPLMLVLFVLFPRISPLWTVPLQSQAARTGVSDSMTPGDIAQLTQSDELAFRATFEGEVPPSSQLYWRGLVLSRFDGRSWTQENTRIYYHDGAPIMFPGGQQTEWDRHIERYGEPIYYSVILEPTNQRWVFALPTPVSRERDIGLLRDYRLMSRDPILTATRYEVTSYLDHRIETDLSPFWRHRTTVLPPEGNSASRMLARSLRDSSPSVQAYVYQVLTMFNEQEFVYTLKPPILGDDAIDEFLLDTRRGFCEHFASSFVFLMRAADIPARVVVGYQGGEYNPVGNYVAVHQFDAHAWAEVWYEGRGWVRVDPTQAVAPERIERGLDAAVEGEGFLEGSPLSLLRYRQLLWLTDIRLQFSALSHYWDSWVVGYNPSMQVRLLSRYFGDVDVMKLGLIMLGVFFAGLGVVAALLLFYRPLGISPPADQAYRSLCGLLEKQGIVRAAGEGPLDFANRVAALRPDLAQAIGEVTRSYIAINYQRPRPRSEDVQGLRAAVRSFRLKLLMANG